MGQQQHFHPWQGWISLCPHPWAQPSLRMGQGCGAILTFRVLPLFGPCRRTRPPSLSPSGLSSSGVIISRDVTSTGWEWGAGAGGLLLELTEGSGGSVTPPLVPPGSRSQACPNWGLKPLLSPALFCCKGPCTQHLARCEPTASLLAEITEGKERTQTPFVKLPQVGRC